MLSLKFPKTEQSQTLTFNFVISLQENKYQKLYVPLLPSKNLVCEFFEGGCHGGRRWLRGGLKSGGAAEIGAQRCRHAKMAPKYRWDEGGDERMSRWGERKSEGAREKTTVEFGGFPTRWEPDLFGTGEGGTILPAYKLQGWMREREEFWEKLKKWGGERGVLNFFGTDWLIPRARFEIFKGKLVFLTFGELSIFETVGLSGRLSSN